MQCMIQNGMCCSASEVSKKRCCQNIFVIISNKDLSKVSCILVPTNAIAGSRHKHRTRCALLIPHLLNIRQLYHINLLLLHMFKRIQNI